VLLIGASAQSDKISAMPLMHAQCLVLIAMPSLQFGLMCMQRQLSLSGFSLFKAQSVQIKKPPV
jgi:hypothetical protein